MSKSQVPTFGLVSESRMLRESFRIPVGLHIEEEIGRGGMGVVYRAFDFELRRDVALKLVLAENVAQRAGMSVETAVHLLREEARYAAELQHTNIVKIFRFIVLHDWQAQISIEDGLELAGEPVACIVMELIKGQKLSDLEHEDGNSRLPKSEMGASIATAIGVSSTDDDAPFSSGSTTTRKERSEEANASPGDQGFMDSPIAQKTEVRNKVVHDATFQSRAYIRRIVEIGEQLASALDHAHELGICHNDIKPQNVMVDRLGNAWLTDFGVANKPGQEPEEYMAGTRFYMAPEVVQGKRSRYADIFSLGATMYHLLTLNGVYDEIQGTDFQSRAENYNKPDIRKTAPHVPKDLASVLEKTLEPKAENRYQTASQLQSDLRAFLDDRDVSTCPVGKLGELVRWSRRNKLTSGLAVAVIAVSIAGSIFYYLKSRHANFEAVRANNNSYLFETAAERARSKEAETRIAYKRASDTLELVNDGFARANPNAEGDLPTSATAVLIYIWEQSRKSTLDDQGMADLLATLSISFLGLGEYDLSAKAAIEDIEIRNRWLEPDDPLLLGSKYNLGLAHLRSGNFNEAERVLTETWELQKQSLGPEHPETLKTRISLSSVFYSAGRYQDALRVLNELIEPVERSFDDDHQSRITFYNNLAGVYQRFNRIEEAVVFQKRVVEAHTGIRGPDHPKTLRARANLGMIIKEGGRVREALASFRNVYEIQRETLPDLHPDTLATRKHIADTLLDLREYDESRKIYEELLPIVSDKFGAEHPKTLGVTSNYCVLLQKLGKWDDAFELAQESLPKFERAFGKEHLNTLTCMNNLAMCSEQTGRVDEAIRIHRQVYNELKSQFGNEHGVTVNSLENFASCCVRNRQFEAAISLWSQLIEVQSLRPKIKKERLDDLRSRLAFAYCGNGDFDKAFPIYESLIANEPDPVRKDRFVGQLMAAYQMADDLDGFAKLADAKMKDARAVFKDRPDQIAGYLARASSGFVKLKAYERAEGWIQESLDICETESLEDWRRWDAESRLGEVRLLQNRIDEASNLLEPSYLELIEHQQAIPKGLRTNIIAQAKLRLLKLLETTNDQASLQKYRDQ